MKLVASASIGVLFAISFHAAAAAQSSCDTLRKSCSDGVDAACLRNDSLGAGEVAAPEGISQPLAIPESCIEPLRGYSRCLSEVAERCAGPGVGSGECPAFKIRDMLTADYWTWDREVWLRRLDCLDSGSQFGLAKAAVVALLAALIWFVLRIGWRVARIARRWSILSQIQSLRNDPGVKAPLICVVADFSDYGFLGRRDWREAFHRLQSSLTKDSEGVVGPGGFVSFPMPWRVRWPLPRFWSSLERREALQPKRAIQDAQALLKYADADFVIAGRRDGSGVELLIVTGRDAATEARSYHLRPNSESEKRAMREDLATAVVFFAAEALGLDTDADSADSWLSKRRRRYLAAMLPVADRMGGAFSNEMKAKLRQSVDHVVGLSLDLDLLSPEMLDEIAEYCGRRKGPGAARARLHQALALSRMTSLPNPKGSEKLQTSAGKVAEEALELARKANETDTVDDISFLRLTQWIQQDAEIDEVVNFSIATADYSPFRLAVVRASIAHRLSQRVTDDEAVVRVQAINEAWVALGLASRRELAEAFELVTGVTAGGAFRFFAGTSEGSKPVLSDLEIDTPADKADYLAFRALLAQSNFLQDLHDYEEALIRIQHARSLAAEHDAIGSDFYYSLCGLLFHTANDRSSRRQVVEFKTACQEYVDISSKGGGFSHAALHFQLEAARYELIVDRREATLSAADLVMRLDELREKISAQVTKRFVEAGAAGFSAHNTAVYLGLARNAELDHLSHLERTEALPMSLLIAALRANSWRIPEAILAERLGRNQEANEFRNAIFASLQTTCRMVDGAVDLSTLSLEETLASLDVYPQELLEFFKAIGADVEADRLATFKAAMAVADALADSSPKETTPPPQGDESD